MSVYCISDIHGRFNEFLNLLKKIEFNKEKDKLYVLGDLVDWGQKSIEVIEYCMENKDCTDVVIGNHDYMMMEFFKENIRYFETGEYNLSNWFMNGGYETLAQLNEIGKEKTNLILEWLNSLDYYITDVEVNGRTFYLCHAYPYIDTGNEMQDKKHCVWERVGKYENPLKELEISKTAVMVAGHTITNNYIGIKMTRGTCRIFKDLNNQKILIDCGAKGMYGRSIYTLACLRLDDLEEFYF